MVSPRADHFLLVVEQHTAPGQKLLATLPRDLFPTRPGSVSPEIVRQCVEHGITRGFSPEAPTGQVSFTATARDLQFERVQQPRPVGRPRKRQPGEKRRPVYVSLEKADRARLEQAAEAHGVPIGTLARMWLLERLERE